MKHQFLSKPWLHKKQESLYIKAIRKVNSQNTLSSNYLLSFNIHIMFFPIWDDQVHKGHKPIFSWIFLAINILVFLFQAWLDPAGFNEFVVTFGSIPSEIVRWEDWYTLITNMFLHWGRMHLIWNMLYLYVFGDNIEASIGNMKFLIFYLLWWIAASAAHIIFNVWSSIPAVGASWAIAAVLGAYLVMFPWSNVKMLYVYGMRTMLVPASYFLIIWIGMQLFSWVGSTMSAWWEWWGTAWWAHIWWFVFWWIAGKWFKKDDDINLTLNWKYKDQPKTSIADLIKWWRKRSPFW